MWDAWKNAWRGWDPAGVVLWILLSIVFGVFFRYTISAIYDWWVSRRR